MDTKILFLDLRGELSSERHTNVPFVLEHFHHLMVMQRYIGASAEKDVDRTCRAHLDRALSSSTAAGSWELRGKHSPDQSDRTCRAERDGDACGTSARAYILRQITESQRDLRRFQSYPKKSKRTHLRCAERLVRRVIPYARVTESYDNSSCQKRD